MREKFDEPPIADFARLLGTESAAFEALDREPHDVRRKLPGIDFASKLLDGAIGSMQNSGSWLELAEGERVFLLRASKIMRSHAAVGLFELRKSTLAGASGRTAKDVLGRVLEQIRDERGSSIEIKDLAGDFVDESYFSRTEYDEKRGVFVAIELVRDKDGRELGPKRHAWKIATVRKRLGGVGLTLGTPQRAPKKSAAV